VLARRAAIAGEASGNPQGILYARLSPRQEPQAAFNLACLQYAQRLYRHFWEQGDTFGQACGVLQLAYTPVEADMQRQLLGTFGDASELVRFVDADEASALAGVPLTHGGLFFPKAGWLKPPALCTALLDHPAIQVHIKCDAGELHRENGNWLVTDRAGGLLARAPVVVVANAREALAFQQTASLPIQSIRGQVSYLPANELSKNLRTVLCSEGYLSPATDGLHCAGATFNLRDDNRELRTHDHQTNLDNLACHSVELAASFAHSDPETLDGRVGFRELCRRGDEVAGLGASPPKPATERDQRARGRATIGRRFRPRYRLG
jgi:tRNA 5-methylaminomethyl-2-thiouridine biosynthesis bifunctional protein